MSWDREFPPEYKPPPEILRLVGQGWAEDYSWHNDLAPSFGLAFPDETLIRIWSHPEDPEDRENPEWERYSVDLMNDPTNVYETYVITNDVEEAVSVYMNAIQPFLKKWPLPKAWTPRFKPRPRPPKS